MSAKSAMENKMKMEDYIDHEIMEIVNNIDDNNDDLIPHINNIDDDDLIFQWKLRKKRRKEQKN